MSLNAEAFPKLQFLGKLLTPGENRKIINSCITKSCGFLQKHFPKLTEFWEMLCKEAAGFSGGGSGKPVSAAAGSFCEAGNPAPDGEVHGI
jgi:hypothetical protein